MRFTGAGLVMAYKRLKERTFTLAKYSGRSDDLRACLGSRRCLPGSSGVGFVPLRR